MKVRDFIAKTAYNLNEVKDFIEGIGAFDSTQDAMSEAAGFTHAIIAICTDEDYTDQDLLDSNIIESPDVENY